MRVPRFTGTIINRRSLTVVGVLVLLSASYGWLFNETKAAGWKDPGSCSPPIDVTGCPIGAQLNTADSIQTKSGDLTLVSGLTISELIVGDATPPDTSICWNGVCKSNWGEVGGPSGNFLPLNIASSGYASIQAPAEALAAWHSWAGPPAGGASTAAVSAVSDGDSVVSYGLYARANYDSRENAALFARAPAGKVAWAAYFAGDVRVAVPWDVVVGGNGTPSSNLPVELGELCIADVCRSTWPASGTGDANWAESGNYLQLATNSYNLGIGGNGSGAPFFVKAAPQQYAADLVVRGSGTTATAASSTEALTIE